MSELIPFDIEKAKAGWPVVTREGKKIVEIYFCKTTYLSSPIIAVIEDDKKQTAYTLTGTYYCNGCASEFDLFLKQKMKTLYVAIEKKDDSMGDRGCSGYAFMDREDLLQHYDRKDHHIIEIEVPAE